MGLGASCAVTRTLRFINSFMFGNSITSITADVVLKDYPGHLTKYEGKRVSKISIFKLSSNLLNWEKVESAA